MEVQRADDEHFIGFGQAYVTCTLPGVIKAWYRHHEQIDQIAVVRGMAMLVLFDDASGLANRWPDPGVRAQRRVADAGPDPPGVWHGFQARGPEPLYAPPSELDAPGRQPSGRGPPSAGQYRHPVRVAMILSLITDDVALAAEAERAGIDRIMIDLEREGKAERQAGRKLFQSSHRLESIAPLKAALERASVMVRINPLSARTPQEVDAVIAAGADVIMLPYFFTAAEARSFTSLVGGRRQVSLLVETLSAIGALPECLAAGGIDEVHIGLNDLSIELGCDVILEPLCTAMIEDLAATLREAGVPFGIGGIGTAAVRHAPGRPAAAAGRTGAAGLQPGLARSHVPRRARRLPAVRRGDPYPRRHRAVARGVGGGAARESGCAGGGDWGVEGEGGAGAGVWERGVGWGRGLVPARRGGFVRRWVGGKSVTIEGSRGVAQRGNLAFGISKSSSAIPDSSCSASSSSIRRAVRSTTSFARLRSFEPLRTDDIFVYVNPGRRRSRIADGYDVETGEPLIETTGVYPLVSLNGHTTVNTFESRTRASRQRQPGGRSWRSRGESEELSPVPGCVPERVTER